MAEDLILPNVLLCNLSYLHRLIDLRANNVKTVSRAKAYASTDGLLDQIYLGGRASTLRKRRLLREPYEITGKN